MSRAAWGIVWLVAAAGCEDPPSICPDDGPTPHIVDEFWGALDTHYAVFDLRLTQPTTDAWDQIGLAACDAVTSDPSDPALFAALVDMARALDDGHVQIESDTDDADGWASVYPDLEAMEALRDVVGDGYAEGPLSRSPTDAHAWGRIGSVGYWSITAMDDLTPAQTEQADLAEAQRIATVVLTDLADTDALIVDVRANEGGWDRVSLAIAERFTGPAAATWSKTQRDGPDHGDFGDSEAFTVAASADDAYDRPVIVLQSGATFSAGETFVLAMRVRDHVTVVGEPSSGHFSDLFDAELENGWTFTYSGERVRAADGMIYEGRGVPVDVPVAFDAAAFEAGTDVMLDTALLTWAAGR